MHFEIITLFPEMFVALNSGIAGRAIDKGKIAINCINPRDFTKDNYGKVDDSPYGGGPGMVMLVEPLHLAIAKARSKVNFPAKTIFLTPQGKKLDQELVKELGKEKSLILLAGRYEGVDERLVEYDIDLEVSIGDYVLSGGELAAMVLIDAITRQIPGVLGDDNSAIQDSFVDGLLDYPHYTRPEVIFDKAVPSVLASGNHKAIKRFRRKEALGRTWLRRPDLLAKCQLTARDTLLLNEFIDEFNGSNL